MSSFAGALCIGSDLADLPTLLPPVEPGLSAPQSFSGPRWGVSHRLRPISPEDQHEKGLWPAWQGRGWVCFSGRLDNRAELAAALGLGPEIAVRESIADGQFACWAAEKWGDAAAAHLLGDFVLAAWNEAEFRLFFASDPVGFHTLYYYRQGGLILFSTTLKGLLACPLVSRRLNDEYIVDYLTLNIGDTEKTFYHDIQRVPPGHTVTITPDKSDLTEHHRFDPTRRIFFKRDEDYVEAAQELLNQAIRAHLRSPAPVNILASGGLDSALLISSLHHMGQSSRLFTSVPAPKTAMASLRGSYNQEQPLVEALVAAFPSATAEFTPPLPMMNWRPDHPHFIEAGACPSRLPAHDLWFEGSFAKIAATGSARMMNGFMGNRTLSWDGVRRYRSLWDQGHYLKLAYELLMTSRGHPRKLAGLIYHQVLRPSGQWGYETDKITRFSGIRPEILQEFSSLDRMKQQGNNPAFLFPGDSRQMRIIQFLRNRGFWRAESMNVLRAAHGLDVHAPFGDIRLVEFCLAIPDDQYERHGVQRRLARRMLRANGAPPSVSENRSRGRQDPEWFALMSGIKDTIPEQIERLRRSPTASRLIDTERLADLHAHWPQDAASASRQANQYRILLSSALSVGAFIAWTEKTN